MTEVGLRAVLETVMDPEIPVVSVMDLGIVREILSDKVIITPTYSGCPATDVIERTIREGKEKLRAYGIAPPELAKAASCPQCGSLNTEEVSRFGSTPCKAQWRCKDCLEPFDRFKCH